MSDLESLYRDGVTNFKARHEILGDADLDGLYAQLTTEEKVALESGISTRRWTLRGKLLHSERDPEREAQRSAAGHMQAKSMLAISVGAGFILKPLKNIQSFLIIEPEAFVVVAFLLNRQFDAFSGKISLFHNTLKSPDALEAVLPWLQGKNLKETQIYLHPPYLSIDKSAATRAFSRVEALFEKRAVNQATIVKFQQLWNKNILLNAAALNRSGSLNALWQLPPPENIVLAGAGPSLTSSLGDLKYLRKKFVLFAADTALVPLNRAGIFPDFVFSADPQWLNHYFCQSPHAAKSVWVMDPVVCPAIPREVMRRGGRILFWNNVFLADRILRMTDRGDVAHGGSVSTNAFDVAKQWLSKSGAETPAKIILVGQDLSFSNRQAHAAGAVLEAQIFARQHRLTGMESHNLRQMKAMPVVWVKGIKQERVRTNGKLRIFHEWFEARAAERDPQRIRYINATHDGAILHGFEHESLQQAVKVAEDRLEIHIKIEPQGIRPLHKLADELAEVRRLSQANARLSQIVNPPTRSIEIMNANDASIKSLSLGKDIAGLNAQAIILKITEHGDTPQAKEFYEAMARAAREILHWLGKVVSSVA